MRNIAQRSLAQSLILALFIAGCGLVMYGLWGVWERHEATSNPNPVIPKETITQSTDKPDETPPHCDDSYQVAADSPRKIEIASISIDGCLQKVGIDQHGAIAVPSNIHLAGWFTDSALPGDKGLSIIDGHVLGRFNDAIFARLKDLRKDEMIRIQFGDLSYRTFTIVSVDSYEEKDTMHQVYEPFDGEGRLVLITCDGTYDRSTNTYDRRVVIRALLTN